MTAASLDELADLIADIINDGRAGYSETGDALWKGPLEVFNYIASALGVTGFQASWGALRFYGQAMNIDGPYMVFQGRDTLYPQYDLPGKLNDWLTSDETRKWQADQARALLELDHEHVHPNVLAHWRKLAQEDR